MDESLIPIACLDGRVEGANLICGVTGGTTGSTPAFRLALLWCVGFPRWHSGAGPS